MSDSKLYDADDLTIGELSIADTPAQEGAVAGILKRHNPAQPKESSMSDNKNEQELAKLRQEIVELKAASKNFTTLDGLIKAERDHYASLDTEKRTEFLGMSSTQRQKVVKQAEAGTEVIYKAMDGTEYTKADNAQMVSLAKSLDDARKEIEVQKAATAEQAYQKRALGYSHLPGSTNDVVAMLKAVDSIQDEAARESVIKMLNAHDNGLSRSFKTAREVEGIIYDDSSAKSRLDKMVADVAAKEGVTHSIAYTKVLDTEVGQELYEQHLAE